MDKNKESIGKLSIKENKIDSWLTKTALNHLYKEFSKLESLLHNLSQKSLLQDLRKFMGKRTTEAQSTPRKEDLREFLRKSYIRESKFFV